MVAPGVVVATGVCSSVALGCPLGVGSRELADALVDGLEVWDGVGPTICDPTKRTASTSTATALIAARDSFMGGANRRRRLNGAPSMISATRLRSDMRASCPAVLPIQSSS